MIKDSRLNAFVPGRQTIMLNSGRLLKMSKPEMLQEVLSPGRQGPDVRATRGYAAACSKGISDTDAASAHSRAVQLSPNQLLILAGDGHVRLAQNTVESDYKTLLIIKKSRSRTSLNPGLLRGPGPAYARTGNKGMTSVVPTDRHVVSGRLQDAAVHAKRASGLLPRGSTGWRRAQDVLHAAETQAKRKTRR